MALPDFDVVEITTLLPADFDVVQVAGELLADFDVVEIVNLDGLIGPPGPIGPPGGDSLAFEYTQVAPLATWTIPLPNTYARRPAVAVYLNSGESVIADTVTSASSVSISFASPTSGTALLT